MDRKNPISVHVVDKIPRISERLVQPEKPSSEYDLDENLNQPS